MKKIILIGLIVMALANAQAAQYCSSPITGVNHNHVANITCQSLGNNQYEFRFESADPISSYNIGSNFYANVNGAGGYHVSEHFDQNGNTLRCLITSTQVPTFYVGDFFVMYADGEEWYKIPLDADFSQACEGVEPVDPQQPDTTGGTPIDPIEPDSTKGTRTVATCSGTSTEVDEFYTSANAQHAVASLTKGYRWTAETAAEGVKVKVQFLDKLNGMAAPYLFRFNSEGVLIGDPIAMTWDGTNLMASYTLTDLYDGDDLTFLVQVALAEGQILFSGRVTYEVGTSCEEQNDVAVEQIESVSAAQKIIRDGRLYILRNGREYDVLGRE